MNEIEYLKVSENITEDLNIGEEIVKGHRCFK